MNGELVIASASCLHSSIYSVLFNRLYYPVLDLFAYCMLDYKEHDLKM